MSDRSCGNCKWSRWVALTPSGKRIKKDTYGVCSYPLPVFQVGQIPECIKLPDRIQKPAIWPDGGNDCPCWERGSALRKADGEDRSGMIDIKWRRFGE